MPISSEPSRNRFNARRLAAWSLLIVAVSAGHISVPWLLGYGSRQVDFANRTPAETVMLTVRRRVAEPTPVTPPSPGTVLQKNPETSSPPKKRAAAADLAQSPSTPASSSAEPAPARQATPLDNTGGEAAFLYAVSGQFGGHTVGGSATLQWKIEPKAYLLSLEVTGSRQFKTAFAWELKTRGHSLGNAMLPESYLEDRLVATEGHQSLSISFSEEASQDSPIPRLDPLSALLKLCSDLHARGSASSPSGATLPAYPIIVRLASRSVQLSFERQGEEDISTPFGALRTEKYVTKYPNAFYIGPQISLWLAPAFRHAPVRVQVEEPEVANLTFDLLSEPGAFPAWR